MIKYSSSTKPLTKRMVETLMECHERELLGIEPLEAATLGSTPGLALRGMIYTHPYVLKSGKEILAVSITRKGKSFLNTL